MVEPDGRAWRNGARSLKDALALLRRDVETERDRRAAALAEIDRVLGRAS